MSIDPRRLAWWALATLSHRADRLGPDPEPPRASLRLALAVLHGLSDDDGVSVRCFWVVLRDRIPWEPEPAQRSYIRRTNARTQLLGVGRSVGFNLHQMHVAAALERAANSVPLVQDD